MVLLSDALGAEVGTLLPSCLAVLWACSRAVPLGHAWLEVRLEVKVCEVVAIRLEVVLALARHVVDVVVEREDFYVVLGVDDGHVRLLARVLLASCNFVLETEIVNQTYSLPRLPVYMSQCL